MIPVNRPLITAGDVKTVSDALTQTLISGEVPAVKEMEASLAKLCKREFAIGVNSGTSAIDLVIDAIEIEEDEICVVPTFTIISTVMNLIRRRAKLRLVDADPLTWSMNAQDAYEKLDGNTRLVMPVHIYGLPVDLNPVLNRARELDIFVLEDAAEALGVDYLGEPCGSFGAASIFSFYANKIVTGGEGGAITTNDSRLAAKLMSLRNLSFSPTQRFVHENLGWNMRLNGLSAALINSQLTRLSSLVEEKNRIASEYVTLLSGHPWLTLAPEEMPYSKNRYWVFPILLAKDAPFNAESLQIKLRENNIETRRFFCPLHLQPLPQMRIENIEENFPVATMLWDRGLYLPSGLGNTPQEFREVARVLWSLV